MEYISPQDNVYDFLMNLKDKKKTYGIEILNLCEISEKRRVAFHAFCTDGIVSASLLRAAGEGDVFIPIDYWALRQKGMRTYLEQLNWHAIIDLEPFNIKLLDLYVDHHNSSMGHTYNARRIHFAIGSEGKSAASVLLNSGIIKVPEYMLELAEITTITDTATYPSLPPVTPVSITTIPPSYAEKIWILDDACRSTQNVKQVLELVEELSDYGFEGILRENIPNRINFYRQKRKQLLNFVQNIELADVVLLINAQDSSIQTMISLAVLNTSKVKVTASLIQTSSGVKISLRRATWLEKNNSIDAQKIRLDLLAKTMNGGGHPYAAGCYANTLSEAIKIISNWSHKLGFTSIIIDVSKQLTLYKE